MGRETRKLAAGSKKARGLKKGKLARNHHARRVMVTRKSRWESQRLFFPYHADLAPFTRSYRLVLHYMKVIGQEIIHGKVSGSPMVKNSGPTTEDRPESTRESKIESEIVL